MLLSLTDAVAYMLLFPKMLHLTCFAHGFHRVADFIRLQHPIANDLIAKVKVVFVKVTLAHIRFIDKMKLLILTGFIFNS